MSHNPYTPPSSHVDDLAPAAVNDEDKADVVKACTLIWISFAASMVGQVVTFFRMTGGQNVMVVAGLVGFAIGGAIAFLINWWVTSRLKLGRNWMRILITVLTCLGLLIPALFWNFYKTAVLPMYSQNKVMMALSLAQFLFWLVALGLLYTARSRRWFAAMKLA